MQKFIVGLVLAVLVTPTVTFAHSALKNSAPADGEAVQGPVEIVEMTFRDDMRITSVKAEGPDGTIDLEIEAPNGTEFVIPTDFGPGSYEINWIGLGPDGHPMKGAFGFEVE